MIESTSSISPSGISRPNLVAAQVVAKADDYEWIRDPTPSRGQVAAKRQNEHHTWANGYLAAACQRVERPVPRPGSADSPIKQILVDTTTDSHGSIRSGNCWIRWRQQHI
jgi:hypothetical protein